MPCLLVLVSFACLFNNSISLKCVVCMRDAACPCCVLVIPMALCSVRTWSQHNMCDKDTSATQLRSATQRPSAQQAQAAYHRATDTGISSRAQRIRHAPAPTTAAQMAKRLPTLGGAVWHDDPCVIYCQGNQIDAKAEKPKLTGEWNRGPESDTQAQL